MAVLGLEPGKQIGLLKKAIEDAVLDGRIPNEHDSQWIVFKCPFRIQGGPKNPRLQIASTAERIKKLPTVLCSECQGHGIDSKIPPEQVIVQRTGGDIGIPGIAMVLFLTGTDEFDFTVLQRDHRGPKPVECHDRPPPAPGGSAPGKPHPVSENDNVEILIFQSEQTIAHVSPHDKRPNALLVRNGPETLEKRVVQFMMFPAATHIIVTIC